MIVMLGLLIIGCNPCKRLQRKAADKGCLFAPDSVKVDVPIYVPPDTINTVVYVDSLIHGDTVTIRDTLNRASIRYVRDTFNNTMYIEAICDTIIDTITVRIKPPPCICPELAKKSWVQQIWSTYANVAGWFVLIVASLGIGRWFVRRRA